MTLWTAQSGSFANDADELENLDRFERISHRQQGACPVRSHGSRTKARMRSLGGPGARQKARTINGAHRRSKYRRAVPSF